MYDNEPTFNTNEPTFLPETDHHLTQRDQPFGVFRLVTVLKNTIYWVQGPTYWGTRPSLCLRRKTIF